MSEIKRSVWFWQRIFTPHMAGLAVALSRRGVEVTYVAEQLMSEVREQQGWVPPVRGNIRLELITTRYAVNDLLRSAQPDSIHLCQGLRGSNGLVGVAQLALMRNGLRHWVLMETVDDFGWRGSLKRVGYRLRFLRWRDTLQGILAIGNRTPDWVADRGMPTERVFPFAYFLPQCDPALTISEHKGRRFRFIFVGQFINRKRLDLLIYALERMVRSGCTEIELAVIGSGASEEVLHSAASRALPGRVIWVGRLPIGMVPQQLAQADCLVLPSRHDGWGAVVSEALMMGTPAVCSDRCGVADVVQASGYGGVFRSGDINSLLVELTAVHTKGRLSHAKRAALGEWARCLGADAGADYLERLVDYSNGGESVPQPPWKATS